MFLARVSMRAGVRGVRAVRAGWPSGHHARAYKMFAQVENKFAYEALAAGGHMRGAEAEGQAEGAPEGELEAFLRRDWRRTSPEELLQAFGALATLGREGGGPGISDVRLDGLVDALTDAVCSMSDEQLERTFLQLARWPETDSVRSRNFIEVWAALDDACLARYRTWTYDEMLKFATLTFRLNIAKSCEYTSKCIWRLAGRAKDLTPSQLLQIMFHMSVLRKAPTEVKFNLELQLTQNLSKFTINDLAVISMGFFKSKTPIRSMPLMTKIIEKIIREADEIDDLPLAALLKLVRYSVKYPQTDIIYRLLSALEPQVARLSVMCCVHVALLGTTSMTLHKSCLIKVAQKVSTKLSEARLKDFERLTLTFALFYFQPPGTNFFELVTNELRNPLRKPEIEMYGRSYACCVYYLTLLEYYATDLINNVLDPSFIEKSYGPIFLIGREVLGIDNVVEIHLKGYEGNRLQPKVTKLLAKKYTDYVPSEDFPCQYNFSEKMVLDVTSILMKLRGGNKYVYGDHALTHYQRGDIFICNDKNGEPMDISPYFPFTPFGIVQRAPTADTWIALVIAARNSFVKNTGEISGPYRTKIRELKLIGYNPAIVSWFDWDGLKSEEEKVKHIQGLIKEAVKT